ncbi:hypothetical protein LINPERPRIM_LOCUS5111 [Linum perenne]
MSFTYSIIGLGLDIAQVVANSHIMGSLTGIIIGPTVTKTHKIWKSFQALDTIIEIRDSGHNKIRPTIRGQDDKEINPSERFSNHPFLHALRMLRICSIW